jgi:Protein phosphatase 2C
VWRHIAQSLQGPSHTADGTVCQDRNSVCVFRDHLTSTLVACVADGAGSAKFADIGSTIACDAIVKNAAAYFHDHGDFDNLDRDEAIRWCEDARTGIKAAAEERDCDCRELATTLCAAVSGPRSSVFFQIGDGAIILRNNGVYGVVFWPQSGEYANSTNFLTADDYQDRLVFLATANGCSDVALLTDGLERLALQFDTQTPHVPFFEPLFRALRSADDVTGLNEGLRQFLGSESVQHRSDDDKTLILASRHNSHHVA